MSEEGIKSDDFLWGIEARLWGWYLTAGHNGNSEENWTG